MPSKAPSEQSEQADGPIQWRTNAWLFFATVASVFLTATLSDREPFGSRIALQHGAEFTFTLLGILLAHEFGHYIAARRHRVPASLPYFIPLPLLSPFGTMGAVIRMRANIPTRKALLDIGAAGPLAGLVVAIPLYVLGVRHSNIISAVPTENTIQLGESLLLKGLDRIAISSLPNGSDIELSPMAFAAWAGMFVTMINLLPVGQLDGGHVAYALFGTKQDRFARLVHRAMLVFFFVSLASYVMRDVRAGLGLHHFDKAAQNSLFWFMWFQIVAVLGALSKPPRERKHMTALSPRTRVTGALGIAILAGIGQETVRPFFWVGWLVAVLGFVVMDVRAGLFTNHGVFDHPPTGTEPLGPRRKLIAIVTLLFFVALFMPSPIVM